MRLSSRRQHKKRSREGRKSKKSKRKMVHVSSYAIHDNGGRPFLVDIMGEVTVYRWDEEKKERGEEVYRASAERVWIGDNLLRSPLYAPRGQGRGNTILVQTGRGQYTFIGGTIYSWETGEDEIQEFYSPIGNSDVPYPYAVGREYVYFLLEKKRVPVERVDTERDGYTQFYGRGIPEDVKRNFRTHRIACAEYS